MSRSFGNVLSRRAFAGGAVVGTVLALTREGQGSTNPDQEDIVGTLSYHVTEPGSTLLDLARLHDMGILEISAVNRGVDVWVPGSNRLIVMPTSMILPEVERVGVVVNLAELRLYHFADDGSFHTHAIGVGRDGFSTPHGQTKVVRKRADPVWYPTKQTRLDNPDLPPIVDPGPDNPLGRHAIYLGWPTYLIHGTNKPYGVGRRVSRGCIRMYPESVEALFSRVASGTSVQVVYEPIKFGWHGGELYVEAHPDSDQLDELEATYDFSLKPAPKIDERVFAKAGTRAREIDWLTLETELIERRGIPVRITNASATEGNDSPIVSTAPANLPGLY